MDLNLLLELKKMARSTFYYHMKNIGNDDKYKDVKDKIATIFHKHKGRYGYRRVTEELRKDVHGINHKTVKRIMDELGLKCEVRKVRYRSYKGDVGKTVSNVINRDFTADRPLLNPLFSNSIVWRFFYLSRALPPRFFSTSPVLSC